jgi:dGTPase
MTLPLDGHEVNAQADAHLAPYAQKNSQSAGRQHQESVDPLRTPFQRDRDRIIHATAFRRLKGKMQVVSPNTGDHFRNRLTHTIEVTQIARDLARQLKLNEDLAEAIALAHDLGHPPFGHAGETALDEKMREHGREFEHNAQSLRIVDVFEPRYRDFLGLNLTQEVSAQCHSGNNAVSYSRIDYQFRGKLNKAEHTNAIRCAKKPPKTDSFFSTSFPQI